MEKKERIQSLDYIRVIACLMVVIVHASEWFYVSNDVINRNLYDGFWVAVINSACRCSVPLFLMVSAYLLVPLRGSATTFFRKRFIRIVIPFAIWSLIYALYPIITNGWSENISKELATLLINFNYSAQHLWFVYMLLGIYLLVPIISPWIRQASKRQMQCYLGIWFFTTFFPYMYTAYEYLYGECPWNKFGLFWYFSGFIGYVIMAEYIKKYVEWSLKKSLLICVPMFVGAYIFTAVVWFNRLAWAESVPELELSWGFCTPNVALCSFAAFVLFRHIKNTPTGLYKIVRRISELSYGIYLEHLLVLYFVLPSMLHLFSTPFTICLAGIIVFIICTILSQLISYIPKSKYLIG